MLSVIYEKANDDIYIYIYIIHFIIQIRSKDHIPLVYECVLTSVCVCVCVCV